MAVVAEPPGVPGLVDDGSTSLLHHATWRRPAHLSHAAKDTGSESRASLFHCESRTLSLAVRSRGFSLTVSHVDFISP